MNKDTFRCKCPITSAVDILGDRWSLVIIKQMLFEGKKTFKDFTESRESIATNILSARLKMLEEFDIVQKSKLPENRKTNIYTLTEKGIALTPVLLELTFWSKDHLQDYNPDLVLDEQLETIRKEKERFYAEIQNNYKNNL